MITHYARWRIHVKSEGVPLPRLPKCHSATLKIYNIYALDFTFVNWYLIVPILKAFMHTWAQCRIWIHSHLWILFPWKSIWKGCKPLLILRKVKQRGEMLKIGRYGIVNVFNTISIFRVRLLDGMFVGGVIISQKLLIFGMELNFAILFYKRWNKFHLASRII